MNRFARGAAGLFVALLLLAPLADSAQAADEQKGAVAAFALTHRGNSEGKAIYRAACATCHGVRGDGRGLEGVGLAWPPTNFRRGVYKLRSTTYESLPTTADLIRTTRDGMPGTEMVPFGDVLSDRSIALVVEYIQSFSPRFANPKEALDPEEDVVSVPAARPFPASAESVAAGREIYEREECGSCHGDDGDGHGVDAAGMTDDWDRPIFMFDWSSGVFKSGTRDADLYRSIATGMNGTPMEAYGEDVSDKELWQLVDYIRSLESPRGLLYALFNAEPSGTSYGRPGTFAGPAATSPEQESDDDDE